MTSKEVIKEVWNSSKKSDSQNIHKRVGLIVEDILIKSMIKKSYDNVTVVIIGLENLSNKLITESPK